MNPQLYEKMYRLAIKLAYEECPDKGNEREKRMEYHLNNMLKMV